MPSHSLDSLHPSAGSASRPRRISLADTMSPGLSGLCGGQPSQQGSNGKGSANKGAEVLTDDQSSIGTEQEDEDDEDDEGDSDDTEKPAVRGPAASVKQLSCDSSSAGPTKRSYDDAIGIRSPAPADDGQESSKITDEPDYPRKKIPKRISTTTQGILAYSEPRFCTDDKTDDDDDKTDMGEDSEAPLNDDDEEESFSEEDEATLTKEFAKDEEILKELGIDEPYASTFALDSDTCVLETLNYSALEDLDDTLFEAMCKNPHKFDDLSTFDWNPFNMDSEVDLFPINPTPIDTPESTPRASISVQGGISRPSTSSSSASSQSDTSDDIADLNPFFEMSTTNPRKRLVSRAGWSDETDDDPELTKYFFSSESSDGTEIGDDATDSDDALTDDGETTDEEEDLPVPLPPSASKLRRASVGPTSRPQIVDANYEGPELCTWVADPTKPIFLVEGNRHICLVPKGYDGFRSSGSISSTSDHWIPLTAEIETDNNALPDLHPSLAGLFGGNVFLDSNDPFGQSTTLALKSEGAEEMSEFFNEDDEFDALDGIESVEDIDEFEAQLGLEDFVDFSSASEAVKDSQEEGDCLSDDAGEEAEEEKEEGASINKAQPDMFSIWDKVSVTAFRKRQFQHNQKHTGHHINGYHKGREGRLHETITPTKKRRVRQKFLVGGMGNHPSVRKTLSR